METDLVDSNIEGMITECTLQALQSDNQSAEDTKNSHQAQNF